MIYVKLLLHCMLLSIAVLFGYGKNKYVGTGGAAAVLFGWVAWFALGISSLLITAFALPYP